LRTANRAPPEREHVLATEEAALRHVAMLVARGAPTPEIFDAVAEKVAGIFGRPSVGVMRYDSAETFVVVATSGEHPFSVGSRWPLDGPSVFEAVLRTGRPAAVSGYAGLPGTVAHAAQQAGIVGGVGAARRDPRRRLRAAVRGLRRGHQGGRARARCQRQPALPRRR
jgi:hypothetical protein